MTRASPTLILGIGTIAFAAALVAVIIPWGVVSPKNVRTLVLSPLFWPYIVAGMTGICGAILLAIHHFRPAAEEAASVPMPNGGARVAGVAVLMVVFYLLIEPLGMIFASMAAYAAFVAISRGARPGLAIGVGAVVVAVALPIALHGFFGHVAGVPVPQAAFYRFP